MKHPLTTTDLVKQQTNLLKQYWVDKNNPTKKDDEEVANSSDFIFDRNNLTITKINSQLSFDFGGSEISQLK